MEALTSPTNVVSIFLNIDSGGSLSKLVGNELYCLKPQVGTSESEEAIEGIK